MFGPAFDGLYREAAQHLEDVSRNAVRDLQNAPQGFRCQHRGSPQWSVAQDRRDQRLEVLIGGPTVQGELLEAARKLNVTADGFPLVSGLFLWT